LGKQNITKSKIKTKLKIVVLINKNKNINQIKENVLPYLCVRLCYCLIGIYYLHADGGFSIHLGSSTIETLSTMLPHTHEKNSAVCVLRFKNLK